ncbi:hypothetical protein PLICRDRAFT_470243 [Plicaturopsis crispa FD-325 SS-3]|nr:hypothetical protein PLICRDRAFT_470243 [Plicaturopsis crispa FD-325 SS-3]
MAGTKLETLPDDVVYAIVAHLPLQDVVRLRQTSKHFQRITHDRVVWADAYRRSSLLRPPGPFPSQPQTELEDILVTTSKVEAAWTSPHPQPVSRRTIPSLKQQSKLRLLYGRWLLIGGPKQELACYDCDASADFGIPVARYPGFICDFACDTAMRSNGNSSLLIAGFQPHRTKKM